MSQLRKQQVLSTFEDQGMTVREALETLPKMFGVHRSDINAWLREVVDVKEIQAALKAIDSGAADKPAPKRKAAPKKAAPKPDSE